MVKTNESIIAAVSQWLDRVVIGLGLCPFAHAPREQGRVRIVVSEAQDEMRLLVELHAELARLEETERHLLETTLLVVPGIFPQFGAFNQFLDLVDRLLAEYDWEGVFQVASFHPDYQFAGTQPKDPSNLTNQSPYPILHLIRETSIDEALAQFADVEQIPQRNIQRMRDLTPEQRKLLFPWR